MDIFDDKLKITAIRLDDRLLHGIIVTQWLPQIKCNRVIIVDDKVANDALKKEVMQLSKPLNVALSIINKTTFKNNMENNRYDHQKLYIITRDISILPLLVCFQYSLPKINVGMYFAKNGTYALSNRIVVNDSDLLIMKELMELGIIFEAQYVPSESAENLNVVIKEQMKEENHG